MQRATKPVGAGRGEASCCQSRLVLHAKARGLVEQLDFGLEVTDPVALPEGVDMVHACGFGRMNGVDLTSLNGFLSGYLHQDWDTEYAGADQAARDFARTAPVATVLRTMAEIDRLLDVGMPDDDLGAWLLSVGCYFRPAGSFREWLLDMKRVMAANLTER